MSWDVPTAEDCPVCGDTMFKKSGRGRMKSFCINPACKNFLPEDQRGYYKKKSEDEGTAVAGKAKKEAGSASKKSVKKASGKAKK